MGSRRCERCNWWSKDLKTIMRCPDYGLDTPCGDSPQLNRTSASMKELVFGEVLQENCCLEKLGDGNRHTDPAGWVKRVVGRKI